MLREKNHCLFCESHKKRKYTVGKGQYFNAEVCDVFLPPCFERLLISAFVCITWLVIARQRRNGNVLHRLQVKTISSFLMLKTCY